MPCPNPVRVPAFSWRICPWKRSPGASPRARGAPGKAAAGCDLGAAHRVERKWRRTPSSPQALGSPMYFLINV